MRLQKEKIPLKAGTIKVPGLFSLLMVFKAIKIRYNLCIIILYLYES